MQRESLCKNTANNKSIHKQCQSMTKSTYKDVSSEKCAVAEKPSPLFPSGAHSHLMYITHTTKIIFLLCINHLPGCQQKPRFVYSQLDHEQQVPHIINLAKAGRSGSLGVYQCSRKIENSVHCKKKNVLVKANMNFTDIKERKKNTCNTFKTKWRSCLCEWLCQSSKHTGSSLQDRSKPRPTRFITMTSSEALIGQCSKYIHVYIIE